MQMNYEVVVKLNQFGHKGHPILHTYIETISEMRCGISCLALRRSAIKPAMLVSSVQAVVACYVTAPKVCTLVLFIFNSVGYAF